MTYVVQRMDRAFWTGSAFTRTAWTLDARDARKFYDEAFAWRTAFDECPSDVAAWRVQPYREAA